MLSLTLWVSRAGWAVHIPTIFLSQWCNIKQWQTPGPPPSPLLPPLVSSLLPFSRSSAATHTLTPHHSSQPQAPSPGPPFGHHGDWKVVQKQHLIVWRLKFSTRESFHLVPSLLWCLSCCWLCAQKMPTHSFFLLFSPSCPTCSFQRNIFLRSAYQSTAAVVLNFHCMQRSDFIPSLSSIIVNPFISWWRLMDAGADKYWSPLRRWWKPSRATLLLSHAAAVCCWDSEWTQGGGLWLSTMLPLSIQLEAPLSPIYEILSPQQDVQTPVVSLF